MAILGVPQPYATIAAASAAAAPGDRIQIAGGYAGNESVTVAVNDLIVEGPASVTGVTLTLKAGVTSISLLGAADFTLRGNAGANSLAGNDGPNVLRGGPGDDTLNGGAERDWADYQEASGPVTVTLIDPIRPGASGSGSSSGADGNDVLISIERIRGSKFDDTLIGNSEDNFFRGNAGNDFIDGSAGVDMVDYGAATASVVVELGEGVLSGWSSGGDGIDRLLNIENIRGSAFADSLTGNSAHNVFRGREGNDIINGGAGRDTVDYINATAGVQVTLTEVIDGHSGGTSSGAEDADTLIDIEDIRGSEFSDTITGNNSANSFSSLGGSDVINGRGGVDTVVYGSAISEFSFNRLSPSTLAVKSAGGEIDTLQNVEILVFSDGILALDPGNSTVPSAIVHGFLTGSTLDSARLEALATFSQTQFQAYLQAGVSRPALGPYEALGRGFAETVDFGSKYGNLAGLDFVNIAYSDVFERGATAAQVGHFSAQVSYFESLYAGAGLTKDAATTGARGAVLGQMLGFATLDEAGSHPYIGNIVKSLPTAPGLIGVSTTTAQATSFDFA